MSDLSTGIQYKRNSIIPGPMRYKLEFVWGNQNLRFWPKIVPKAKLEKKKQPNSWRCFKNYGILRFGLVYKQKSLVKLEIPSYLRILT